MVIIKNRAHENVVSNVKIEATVYTCFICNKEFKTRTGLKRHGKKCENRGE